MSTRNRFKLNSISKIIPIYVILFIIFLFISSIVYAELYWAVDTIDSSGDVGSYCSMVNDGTNFHVSYYDASNGDLKYAYYDGGSWSVETVDTNGDVGLYSSIALDSSDNIHISYYNASANNLKYAYYDGISWSVETVDTNGDVGTYCSLALNGSNPCISYYNASSGDLLYAEKDGSWSIELVDSEGNVGTYCSLAFDGTEPCISYFNSSNNTLKYAKKTGGNWNNQTIDNCEEYSSLVIDSSTPHIVYVTDEGHLNHTTYSGSWSFETIDSSGDVGSYCSLILDGSNFHVAYYDTSDADLKYAYYDTSWNIETIISSGSIGRYSAIAVESDNQYFVCYDESNDDCVFISEKDADPPSEPFSLNGIAYEDSVDLQWYAPNETGGAPIISYHIYRGFSLSELNQIGAVGNTTTYVDNNIENGKTYFYLVSAENAVGESNQSGSIAIDTPITPPSRPTDFDVTAYDGYVIIEWSQPNNNGGSSISNYRLYKGTSQDSLSLKTSTIENDTFSYNDTDVTNGIEYFYQVSAVNTEDEGDKTKIKSDTPEGMPGEPENVHITFYNNTIILSWNEPDSDGGSTILNYQIYRGKNIDSLEFFVELSFDERNYIDDTIEPNQAYYYEISAVNINGESPPSDMVSVTEPDSPEGLTVSGHDEYVSLSWSKPDEHNAEITKYKIYRGQHSSNIDFFKEISNDDLAYQDESVENGITYYYKVSAVNAIGESILSSWRQATPMGVSSLPRNLSLSFQGGLFQSATVVLNWDAPLDDGGATIESYIIYKGKTNSSLDEYVTLSGSSLSYTDTDVPGGNTYYYAVSAVNEVGESNKTSVQPVDVPSFLIYYILMGVVVIVVIIIFWSRIAAIKAYLQFNKIKQRFESFVKKDESLLVDDIEQLLDKKNPQSVLEAEKLLNERVKQYEEFNKLKDKLKDINTKIDALAQRLSNGELTSDAFKRARQNLEREKKDLEERFWKIRNKLFKDEYEKPF